VWLDQLDISPGQRWDREVEDALTNCKRMIVILSPSSVNSTNVMDEVSFALENQKSLIPVLRRDCAIPFRMRRVQYADFRLDYARGLKDLLKTLEVKEFPPPPPPPQPPLPKWVVVALGVAIAVAAGGFGTYEYYEHKKAEEAHGAKADSVAADKAAAATDKTAADKTAADGAKADKAAGNRATPIGSGILLAENLDVKRGNSYHQEGKLVLLDRSQNKITWEKEFGSIRCLAQTQLGAIIVCDEERIVKMARNGEILSSVENKEFNGLNRAIELNDGSLLLASGIFNWVRQIDWTGQTIWSVSSKLHFPSDVQRLPDGNTLIADSTSVVIIVAENGQIAQRIPVSSSSFVCTASRLRNRYTVVGLSGTVVLLDENNNTVWNSPSVGRPASVEQMSSGEFLVADPDNNRVIILESKTGKISWSKAGLERLVGAIELR
jgi:hypothetical protein